MRAFGPLAVCLALGAPAQGQSLTDQLTDQLGGLWGSVSDPATSCAANPHRIALMGGRPHAFLTWSLPRTEADGRQTREIVYDIDAATANSLDLRREVPREFTEAGTAMVRILRLSQDGQTYCWGRADWPSVRCEDHQQRCDAAVPSS